MSTVKKMLNNQLNIKSSSLEDGFLYILKYYICFFSVKSEFFTAYAIMSHHANRLYLFKYISSLSVIKIAWILFKINDPHLGQLNFFIFRSKFTWEFNKFCLSSFNHILIENQKIIYELSFKTNNS